MARRGARVAGEEVPPAWAGQSALAIPREGPPHRRLKATPFRARRAARAILAPFLLLPPPLNLPMAPPKKADKKPAQKTAKTAAKKGSKKRAKVSRPV